jgi:hypothetical protein
VGCISSVSHVGTYCIQYIRLLQFGYKYAENILVMYVSFVSCKDSMHTMFSNMHKQCWTMHNVCISSCQSCIDACMRDGHIHNPLWKSIHCHYIFMHTSYTALANTYIYDVLYYAYTVQLYVQVMHS